MNHPLEKQLEMIEQILDKYSDQNGSDHLHPSVENPLRIALSNIRTELDAPKKKLYVIITNHNRKYGRATHDQIEIVELDDENASLVSFENFNILIPVDLLFGKALMYIQQTTREPTDPLPDNIFGE